MSTNSLLIRKCRRSTYLSDRRSYRHKDIAIEVYSLILLDNEISYQMICNILNDFDRRRVGEVLDVLYATGYYMYNNKRKRRKTATITLHQAAQQIHQMIKKQPKTVQEIMNTLKIPKRLVSTVLLVMKSIGVYCLKNGKYTIK